VGGTGSENRPSRNPLQEVQCHQNTRAHEDRPMPSTKAIVIRMDDCDCVGMREWLGRAGSDDAAGTVTRVRVKRQVRLLIPEVGFSMEGCRK
jgi:hypothetical protein